MQVKLLALTCPVDATWSQETVIEYSARTCYNSQDKLGTNGNFIQGLIKRGHTSTIEHLSFCFEISGITRACANQLVRHRIASYSQESTRYCDMSTQDVIEPESIKNCPYCHVVWTGTIRAIKNAYKTFREHGIKKEDARAILPLNLETKMIMTVNARELLHVIKLRTSPKAQEEIREVALEMERIARQYAPSIFRKDE